ncbi:basic-leucine zipper transcription factor f-related [Anaeramoeba flamelloides]|uniref:Basic-leucine zipper transcription factor f-related n=1 Tax=Anaeramoeba flamelloides TaxID=1746091 RepID=A0AAV7ZZ26_9EUKA|nr:basic-leucine zipper transcription factor f-related [Anaeramoeba flamelloides]
MHFHDFLDNTLEDFPTYIKINNNIPHELSGDLSQTFFAGEHLIDLNNYFPEEVNLDSDQEEQNRDIFSNYNKTKNHGLPINVTNTNLLLNDKNLNFRRQNNLKIEQNSRKIEQENSKILQTPSKIQNNSKISNLPIEKQSTHEKEKEATTKKQTDFVKFLEKNANPKIIKKRKKFKKVIQLKKRNSKNGIKTHVIKKNIIKKKKLQKSKTMLPPEILALKPPKKRSQLNQLNIEMTDYENYQLRSLSKEKLAQLSKTEKNERKRIRDRISARNSRNKQKIYLERLEKHCLSIITEKKQFENKLNLLKKENVELKKEIVRLESKLNLKNKIKVISQESKNETRKYQYQLKNNTQNILSKKRRLLKIKKKLGQD